MEISGQDLFGVDKGERRPYGLCLGTLTLQQISQNLIKFLTSFRNLGHKKLQLIKSKVLETPK